MAYACLFAQPALLRKGYLCLADCENNAKLEIKDCELLSIFLFVFPFEFLVIFIDRQRGKLVSCM